ncbi:type I polyketide synthase, partial [Paractinoplanes durhamensis]
CAQVDEVRDEILTALEGIRPGEASVPMWSTVTGEWVTGPELDAGYWFSNLRRRVRFAEAVDQLSGYGLWVECAPHPVLASAIPDTPVVGSLRRGDDGPVRWLTSLGQAWVRGAVVDWRLPRPSAPVDLPTYAFQRERFWLVGDGAGGDPASLGQAATGHPVLASVVGLAGGGMVFTGRVGVATHPWLADHAVAGMVLAPGTLLLELVLRAGEEVGCPDVTELTLHTPMTLPDTGSVQVQVAVTNDSDSGKCTATIHTRPDIDPESPVWTLHATAALTAADDVTAGTVDLTAWPPPGAQPADGTETVWRRGDEIFAEVTLPAEQDAGATRYGIHPALLDLALDAAGDAARRWPASWTGVRWHSAGAAGLRVRFAPAGADTFSLHAADEAGNPVLTAASVALRPIPAEAGGTPADVLFRLHLVPVPVPGVNGGPGGVRVHRCDTVDEPLPSAVRTVTMQALAALTVTGAETLVVVTRAGDLAHAAVRGLVRSAQAEQPGRFVLVETETETVDDDALLAAAVASGEPELAIRDGALLAPRLTRVASAPAAPVEPGGTVMVVGTGAMGRFVARHLVVARGAHRLLLVNRSGLADELVAELTGLGAEVTVAACDAADRIALAALLDSVPALTGVVHCAGLVADGLVGSITADQLDAVLRPKVDAAVNLDELTRDRELSLFLLCSSATGVFGNAGQGAFGAANAFLDALAVRRREAGRPAVALAWGPWEPLAADAPALFDRAAGGADALVVAWRPDLAAVRAADQVPPLLRELVPNRSRRRANGVAPVSLARRIAGRPAAEQLKILLDVVRGQVAAVLGHTGGNGSSSPAVGADRPFKELGFDSLTAVELRNRLNASTGLQLPATLVFTYPTATAVARHLRAELNPDGDVPPVLRELDRLENVTAGQAAEQPDDETRRLVTQRLEALLRRWRGDVAELEPAALDSASAEDVFALIDRSLGRP